MEHVRSGYYTIEYEGALLLNDDGSTKQHTNRDECWETISNDVREGEFIIHCPDRVIKKKVELME